MAINTPYKIAFVNTTSAVIKATLKLPTILAVCSIITPTTIFATELMFKPSVGVDVGIRSMQFQDLYGKDHFANRYNYISPYLQANVLEHLGVKTGIETSDTRHLRKNYAATENWLGVKSGGNETKFYSSSKVNGVFIGIYANTSKFWEESIPTKLSFFIGVTLLKTNMSHTEMLDLTSGNYIDQTEIIDTNTKAIPKLSISSNLFIPPIPGLSVTASYGFEKTSNLSAHKSTSIPLPFGYNKQPLLIKLKNSYYSSLGVNYQL